MSYVFSLEFFFHCCWFSPCIDGRKHFSFSHRCYEIFIFVVRCFFISRSSGFCRSFSLWASLAYRLISLFLCLSLALYSKSVDMTLFYYSRQQGYIPLSGFLFIDSLFVSALQDAGAGGYAIFRQNNLELYLGWHSCWLSYFSLVCLWCGWTVDRAGRRMVAWLPKILEWADYLIFLPMVLPCSTANK